MKESNNRQPQIYLFILEKCLRKKKFVEQNDAKSIHSFGLNMKRKKFIRFEKFYLIPHNSNKYLIMTLLICCL